MAHIVPGHDFGRQQGFRDAPYRKLLNKSKTGADPKIAARNIAVALAFGLNLQRMCLATVQTANINEVVLAR